jgi:hypothetical protein
MTIIDKAKSLLNNSYLFTVALWKVIHKATHRGQGNKGSSTSMPEFRIYALLLPYKKSKTKRASESVNYIYNRVWNRSDIT